MKAKIPVYIVVEEFGIDVWWVARAYVAECLVGRGEAKTRSEALARLAERLDITPEEIVEDEE